MTLTSARARMRRQIEALTRAGKPWRTSSVILSTNIRFTISGARDQNVSRRDPADPGVAVYFDLDGRSHVLACDRWDTVPDNIAAIAAHIEALRGQERWGVADMRQAFAGHVALPPAGTGSAWRSVLGFVATDRPTRADIDAAYRRRAATAHPDATGGPRDQWDSLVAAHEAAKMEIGS